MSLAFMELETPNLGANLVVRSDITGCAVSLGPATKKRITELQEYLERLKIHAT